MDQIRGKQLSSLKCFKPITENPSSSLERTRDECSPRKPSTNSPASNEQEDHEKNPASPPTVNLGTSIQSSKDEDKTDLTEEASFGSSTVDEDRGAWVISPYPLAPSPQELEERNELTRHLGSDWSMSDGACSWDQDDERQEEENIAVSPTTLLKTSYSEYYFQSLPPTENLQVPEANDDISFICDEDTILNDDEQMSLSEEPVTKSIWDESIAVIPNEVFVPLERGSTPSPAQVSVGSERGLNEEGDDVMMY